MAVFDPVLTKILYLRLVTIAHHDAIDAWCNSYTYPQLQYFFYYLFLLCAHLNAPLTKFLTLRIHWWTLKMLSIHLPLSSLYHAMTLLSNHENWMLDRRLWRDACYIADVRQRLLWVITDERPYFVLSGKCCHSTSDFRHATGRQHVAASSIPVKSFESVQVKCLPLWFDNSPALNASMQLQ